MSLLVLYFYSSACAENDVMLVKLDNGFIDILSSRHFRLKQSNSMFNYVNHIEEIISSIPTVALNFNKYCRNS